MSTLSWPSRNLLNDGVEERSPTLPCLRQTYRQRLIEREKGGNGYGAHQPSNLQSPYCDQKTGMHYNFLDTMTRIRLVCESASNWMG